MDNSNETLVDKAVNFVKDVFGVAHEDEVVARPATDEAAEAAMSLDPNAYVGSSSVVGASEQIYPGSFATPIGESQADRLRREVDESPRQKTPMEYSSEMVRRENGV